MEGDSTRKSKKYFHADVLIRLLRPPLLLNPQIYLVFLSIYSAIRHPELAAVCRDSRTLILYPGPKSQNLEELVQYSQEVGTVKHNVIIIDGTWSQAKNMFLKNTMFHLPKQVCVCCCYNKEGEEYSMCVIRGNNSRIWFLFQSFRKQLKVLYMIK